MAGRCGCSSGCGCAATSSESVQVLGIGEPGAAWTPSVIYSTDAGNRARAGTDGGVFADVCVLDPAGDPVEPDEDGCLPLPAPSILDYNGDPIPPEPDGSIQLPAGGEAPPIGCGLQVTDGTLSAKLSGTWPPDDLAGDPVAGAVGLGGATFCDADGKIRGVPEHTTVVVQGPTEEVVASPVVLEAGDPAWDSTTTGTTTATNPSSSRSVLGRGRFRARVAVNVATAFPVFLTLQAQIGGGAWVNVGSAFTAWTTDGPAGGQDLDMTGSLVATIAPGASWAAKVRIEVQVGADDGASIEILSARCSVGFDGGTI